MTLDPHLPDPNQPLALVQADEKSRQRGSSGISEVVPVPTYHPESPAGRGTGRGRLKIFLGYAAGVGKTYAMLEAACQRRREGLDVVIGYVETHQRAETDLLAKGLEIIPRKNIEYRGIELTEMDVDAVLARHPRLALVDELAHTNAPG